MSERNYDKINQQGRYDFFKNWDRNLNLTTEFLTISPPKWAGDAIKLIYTKKLSEIAFQKCL